MTRLLPIGYWLKHVDEVITDVDKAERETLFTVQSAVRRRALQGISNQEYMTVLDVLQRMVKDLE